MAEYPKTYIVTTAQRGAVPFKPFLNSLKSCAKFYDGAEILILETNGKETTSRRGKDNKEIEVLDPNLNAYRLVTGDFSLNEEIQIRHFPVKAQQMIPFTSFERFVPPGKTAIMASPKQMLICRPHSTQGYPKIFVSTGAVTLPNYKDNRWGNIARLDHRFGAVIVEVENPKKYHFRVLNADSDGAFYDLGMRFYGDEKPEFEREEVMVLGDWHEGYPEKHVIDATERAIRGLRPKRIFIHDLFDGDAISFFHQNDILAKAKQAMYGTNRLEDSLRKCGERLEWFRGISPEDTEIFVVKSNHDERLDRYVKEMRYTTDPANALVGSDLFIAMHHDKDPLLEGIAKYHGSIPKGITFLGRGDDYNLLGWTLSVHGDPSPGRKSRMSASELERNYGKIITGHTHSPEIVRDVMRVGTSTPLWMDYTIGRPSDWLNTHALLPRNGKPQLFNITEGTYTCKK
jgi:hypothetical protein